jgi:ABC-type glycerol-3-phosphate transport system substrate-binding protein
MGTGALGLSFAGPARAAATGNLSVWKFGGTTREVEFWPKRDAEFLAANPGLNLKYSYFNGQIRRQKIQAGFQTRQLPDVFIAFGQDLPELVGFRMIQPIDALAGQERVAGWKERIVPEVLANGMWEDKIYGLPVYVDMDSFIAVNLDALAEAGLEGPPKTWSELRDYAKKLTKPDRPGFAFPATTTLGDINIFEGIAYANGGRIYDPDTNKVTLTDPGVVDALQLYVDLIKDGSTPAPQSMTETHFRDTAQLFAQGRAAMWVGGSWLNTPWPVPETTHWTGAPFPRPDKVSGSYPPASALADSSAMLYISADSQNTDAAIQYVDFWSQNEQLDMWDGDPEYSRIPAGKEAWTQPELAERWPEWVAAYKAGTMFEGAQPLPRFIGVTVVETGLGAAIQQAVLGQKTPADALAEAEKAAQQQIDLLRG